MSIPKDGYYIAVVQCDSGGETAMHVQVINGVPQTVQGDALVQSACSQFMEVSASEFCRVWSKDAAMELEALRTANAGLVKEVRQMNDLRERAEERVRRLEHAAGLALGYASKGDFESADEVMKQAKGQP